MFQHFSPVGDDGLPFAKWRPARRGALRESPIGLPAGVVLPSTVPGYRPEGAGTPITADGAAPTESPTGAAPDSPELPATATTQPTGIEHAKPVVAPVPFPLPETTIDIDEEFLTNILRHRALLPEDIRVCSCDISLLHYGDGHGQLSQRATCKNFTFIKKADKDAGILSDKEIPDTCFPDIPLAGLLIKLPLQKREGADTIPTAVSDKMFAAEAAFLAHGGSALSPRPIFVICDKRHTNHRVIVVANSDGSAWGAMGELSNRMGIVGGGGAVGSVGDQVGIVGGGGAVGSVGDQVRTKCSMRPSQCVE